MGRKHTGRSVIPAVFAALVLLFFSASGLMAGTVVSGILPPHASATSTAASGPAGITTATPASTALGAAHATATPTITSSQLATTPYTLQLAVTPNPAHSSQLVHVTVHATADTTKAAQAGVKCQLEAPEDGARPLLATWPPATVTDSTGTASWDLDVSNIPPGAYFIGVTSVGMSYMYHAQISISILA